MVAKKGFSLVEICLALGIIAFALVPLVGLLTVGLDSYHNANLRGRAAQVVSKLASAIRLGNVTNTANTYAAAAPFELNGAAPISWTLTAKPSTAPNLFPIYFDENGEITTLNSSGNTNWNPPQMVAMVVLTPPTTKFDAGKAQVVVAWPALGAPSYSVTTGITFINPQGHDESTISFVSNPP